MFKNYNLSSGTHLSRLIVHTTHYGTETMELVPQSIKEAKSLSSFKDKVKKWILKTARVVFVRHT